MKKEYIVEWDWEYYAFDSEDEAVAFAEEQWNSVSKEDQDEVEKMQVYEVETESGIRMMAYEDNKNFMTRMIKNYKEKDA